MFGSFYIVGTPIGNIEDITYRAIKTLSEVDLILCEDTRHTKRLLDYYEIKNKTLSYNDYNEAKRINQIITYLKDGMNLALVSDAGMPGISDPGYRISNYIRDNEKDINIFTIPGASSVTAGLSVSGLPSDKFYFCGFLPKKKGRNKMFNIISEIDCSIIIFESPKRIYKTLNNIYDYLGNRFITICKEMTKIHESYYFGFIKDIIDVPDKSFEKGEIVIIISKNNYKP